MQKLRSILLVDDDPIMNFLHQLLLEEMSVFNEVVVKVNGQQALDFLKAVGPDPTTSDNGGLPDLILLDINMPLMDGWETLEALHQQGYDDLIQKRIVMLTSSRHFRDLKRAKDYDVRAYLEKPLQRETLTELLKELSTRSVEREQ